MIAAGVPVVPGSEGMWRILKPVLRKLRGIGYPVIIKGSSWRRRKGMRVQTHRRNFRSLCNRQKRV